MAAPEQRPLEQSGHDPVAARNSPDRPETLPPSDTPSKFTPNAEMPETLGRYRILKKLGQGGMGSVFLALDTQLERQVALKVPHFSPTDGVEALERFFREARAAATLHHPNICPIHDVGEIAGTHYLTMAYVEGRPLTDLVRANQGLPVAQATALVRKVALALEEAHRHGIVHRDLKPANIMINQRKEPVIMDFGLARKTSNQEVRLTKSGAIVGTPAYMSPEQIGGKEVGPASDVFSLGVILYELLTGRLPFDGPMMAVLGQILTEDPEPPSRHRPDLDPTVEAICLKALAKDTARRYSSMGSLASALTDYLRGAGNTEKRPAPAETQSPFAPERKPTATPKAVGRKTAREPPWEEVAADTPTKKKRSRRAQQPMWQKPIAWIAAGGALVLIVAVMLLSGLIFQVRTKTGVVVLTISEPGAKVFVDDELKITLTSPSDKEPIRIEVPEGKHVMKVTKGGFVTETREFKLRAGTPEEIRVVLRPEPAPGGKTQQPVVDAKGTAPAGWSSLFNGIDLDGWEGLQQYWSVKDGAIRGSAGTKIPFNTFLCTKKKYRDFELRFQVRLTPDKCNTGVQIRSQLLDRSKFTVKGPQCDMGLGCWGSLYGELFGGMMQAAVADVTASTIKRDDFNDFHITCVGRRVIIRMNGVTTVDNEFPAMPDEGIIALQMHVGEPMEVVFRDLFIKELAPGSSNLDSWKTLFNGKDLAGWQGDEKFWSVAGGAIVGAGPPGKGRSYLSTTKSFKDFVLKAKVKPIAGDTSIMWRGKPNKAFAMHLFTGVLDSGFAAFGNLMDETPVERGEKYIRVNNWDDAKRQAELAAIKRENDWNDIVISAIDDRYVVKINDYVINGKHTPGPREGVISLKVLANARVAVKDLQIQEVRDGKSFAENWRADRTDRMETSPPSWASLFNGINLAGWNVDSGNPKGWRVAGGELVADGTAAGKGWLLTERSYSDFQLRLEFRLTSQANSGVAFRAIPGAKKHAEIQILDDTFPKDSQTKQRTGSLYDLAIDQAAKLKPVGTWNTMEVEVIGRKLRVSVNGQDTLRTDLDRHVSANLPGLTNASGRIGLQNWGGGEVRFRKIELKEVAP